MNLWSLLLPFKWFIIGVGVVFNGIGNILKKITFFLGSLFKYLYEGIIIVSRGIWLLLSNILIKGLFNSIKWVVLKITFIILLFLRGLKIVLLGLFKLIKMVILALARALKFIIVYAFKGLSIIIKYLFLAIKYFLIYLFKTLNFIFKYLFIAIKYFFIYLFKTLNFIFKYLFIAIRIIFTYVGKFAKLIIVDILVKYLGIVFKYIFKGVVIILRFIISIPIFLWRGIKYLILKLYDIITYPFVYLYNNFGRIIGDALNNIKSQIKRGVTFVTNIPNNIRASILNWFNNLSIVKDMHNRREMKRQALLIDFDTADATRSEKKVMYRYVAKNSDGKIEKGRLGAYSKLDVHSYLLAEGYEVYEIEPYKGLQLSIGGHAHKLKMSSLVFFLTQLSTYIKSGIPLVDSIKILGKQERTSNTKTLYKGLVYDLTMGDSFSEALEKQGDAFPRLLVNMVKSSELAGNLSETLDDMADYYNAVSQTRKQMKSALTYPTVILIFAISVVVFILTFVIPSFIDMYKDADAQVPAITTFIINLSAFLTTNAIWLIIGVVAIIIGFYFMYKNIKVFRMLIQWILMHTPIIGKIIIYNEVTMFSKTFASLWNHNVFITSSMEILSKITNNEIYKMLIFDAITNVARGEPVSASFKNHWAFPVVAYEMLVTGERTGQPGPMMDKVATFYQEEHKNAINQVKAFIEPALIIFLAFIVGTILLSVVIPMFSIYGQLGLTTGQQ